MIWRRLGSGVPSVDRELTSQRPIALSDRLVDVATELFRQDGFQAVGVQRIVDTARTTKQSLYRHFKSKDELAAACIRKQVALECACLQEVAEQFPRDPLGQLRASIDALARRVRPGSLHVWPLTRAALELPTDDRQPGRQAVSAHKAELRGRFEVLARDAGLSDPDCVAAELMLLLEGAGVSAQAFSAYQLSEHLMDVVDRLLSRVGSDRNDAEPIPGARV